MIMRQLPDSLIRVLDATHDIIEASQKEAAFIYALKILGQCELNRAIASIGIAARAKELLNENGGAS